MTGEPKVKPQSPQRPEQEPEADEAPADWCRDCGRDECCCYEPDWKDAMRGER